MPVTGPRCPNKRNNPVSAITSHKITTPSAPPLANRPTLPMLLSKTTICTGEDPCPFNTNGSLHANSSLFPKKLLFPPSNECTRPFLSESSPTPLLDVNLAISLGSNEKTRTDPSTQPVATLTSSLAPASSPRRSLTSRHTIWLEFSARPVPTPPLNASRWPIFSRGSPRLNS